MLWQFLLLCILLVVLIMSLHNYSRNICMETDLFICYDFTDFIHFSSTVSFYQVMWMLSCYLCPNVLMKNKISFWNCEIYFYYRCSQLWCLPPNIFILENICVEIDSFFSCEFASYIHNYESAKMCGCHVLWFSYSLTTFCCEKDPNVKEKCSIGFSPA